MNTPATWEVCDNNASNFSVRAEESTFVHRVLKRRSLRETEGFGDAFMTKQSRLYFAVVAVCFLGALLTGCSRDPNVRKQKYLESGERYFDKGQYKEAAIQFENAIQVDARFTEAHYKLAQTAMKLQQWPGAYQELVKTVELQPDHYAAHLDMANLLIANRQLSDAKEHLDLLTQKQPNNPEVFVAVSNYALLNNDGAGAMAAMQKALQLDPNRSDSYLSLAAVQMRASQWDSTP